MLKLEIPGFTTLTLEHLVLDYNGTLATDGKPVPGVIDRLRKLQQDLKIHIVTADTFGTARAELSGISDAPIVILEPENQARAKRSYVDGLGASHTVCIGNGRNDRFMLEAAALAVAVVQSEGAAGAAVQAAHIVTRNINEALDLLLNPKRLVATLRG